MAALAWVMMGLAIWHFAIFIPDRFWGGIVGSLICAIVGAVIVGLIFAGFTVPGNDTITVMTAIEAIPGALLGLLAAYAIGARRGNPPLHL
ncbi:MAG: hypothetical protein F2813_02990 [Actinobacteria bacterium]|uniref:Unannotated protein n=1 Tax=freshwater metagenome TaxID=449393 RepID=A0A6J5ZFP5_9ZZZZ|nr:hypothetical protein [Actinomycetota bacterium]